MGTIPSNIKYSFDFIKTWLSTLDCLLCADDDSVPGLLSVVHESLICERDDSDIDRGGEGGVFVLVTFHPHKFIHPLLRYLPGADWD